MYIYTYTYLQVPLGVILKSESKTEEMIDILEDLHQYVPTTSTTNEIEVPGYENEKFSVNADTFHHTLIGNHIVII